MEKFKIIAQRREPKGKGAARRLRAQGLLPVIFYGPKRQSTPLAFEAKDLIRILQHGQNVLIDLKFKDEKETKTESGRGVMVRDVQNDPLTGMPIHADLLEVSMQEVITVEVPIRLVGKPAGIEMGGILEQVRRELEVECLPADLPSQVEVDVGHLDIGDSIHVQDITVDRVKVLTEPDVTIATVVPPVAEKEVEVEAAPEEGEEEVEAPTEEGKETAKKEEE
jgi:large subunit ribosomal protein L25